MTYTDTSPADALRAIISAGVAAYQSSLPDFARGDLADVDERIERHRSGNGARLMEVVTQAGIGWRLARTWQGNRKLERQLKRRRNAPKLCPVCSGVAANNRAREKSR